MPAGHTSKYARRPYVYSMPTSHTSAACLQAIHLQHALRPYIYRMPAGHILQHGLQAVRLQHAHRPYVTASLQTLHQNRARRLVSTCYNLATGTLDHNLPSGLTHLNLFAGKTYFNLPAGQILAITCPQAEFLCNRPWANVSIELPWPESSY